MAAERRRAERVIPDPLEPVEVQVMGNGFLEIVHATNVSVGGVGFYLPHGLGEQHLNTPVEVILTLPNCRSAHLRGIIRHLDDCTDLCHLGVQFVRPPSKVEAALQRYVTRYRHRPYSPPAAGSAR